MHWQYRAFSAEARRDEELSDEEVALMGYEPKLDVAQQTQLPQLSAVAGSKIREIAEICNAQLKTDKVSIYTPPPGLFESLSVCIDGYITCIIKGLHT